MTTQHTDRFIPFTNIVTDEPVLMIDSQAPLRDLHACVSERLHAALNYLTLMACTNLPDYVERDINTVTNVAFPYKRTKQNVLTAYTATKQTYSVCLYKCKRSLFTLLTL